MLEYALKRSLEILLLGMLHVNTAYNLLQNEVCSNVFPMIVKSAACSGMILYIWHVNPNFVLWGFVDTHNIEPDCLNKILDICQEIKILSPVLGVVPSAFSIRLVALASGKEIIDLEKWLSNNLVTYKDYFFEEYLKFLKDFQVGGSRDFSAKRFHHASAVVNLYMECSSTFLKVLKAHTGVINSTQLAEELGRLHGIVMDSNSRLQNGSSRDLSVPDGYSDEVEAEANSYFHQMFSSQLSINAMVQILG